MSTFIWSGTHLYTQYFEFTADFIDIIIFNYNLTKHFDKQIVKKNLAKYVINVSVNGFMCYI